MTLALALLFPKKPNQVLSARSPLVAVAAPAVALAVLAGGLMVATGGHIPHIHIPHVDVSVFIV